MGFSGDLSSGKQPHHYVKIHHFQWENSRTFYGHGFNSYVALQMGMDQLWITWDDTILSQKREDFRWILGDAKRRWTSEIWHWGKFWGDLKAQFKGNFLWTLTVSITGFHCDSKRNFQDNHAISHQSLTHYRYTIDIDTLLILIHYINSWIFYLIHYWYHIDWLALPRLRSSAYRSWTSWEVCCRGFSWHGTEQICSMVLEYIPTKLVHKYGVNPG